MANFYKKSQSGHSMIEMLGVLAIIGVLSVAGIAGYGKAMEKHKLQKAVDQILMIVTNVQTLFGDNRDYSVLKNKAYSLGVFPTDMAYSSETTARNAYGLSANVDGTLGGWTLQYWIPTSACIAMATMNWGGSIRAILINYTFFDNLPIQMADAERVCGRITDKVMFFRFNSYY